MKRSPSLSIAARSSSSTAIVWLSLPASSAAARAFPGPHHEPQDGTVSSHVRPVPKGDSEFDPLQPLFLTLLFTQAPIRSPDPQQRILHFALQNVLQLHALDLVIKPRHIRLHVVASPSPSRCQLCAGTPPSGSGRRPLAAWGG